MREPSLMPSIRFKPDSIDQAKVPKLCITPLGAPVVPEVYMMVASSSPSRSGWPASGAVLATTASQSRVPAGIWSMGGASGSRMQASPAATAGATPGRIVSQPSSLPMNSQRASLWSKIWRMVSAASVG